jgi:hypothetical protein
MSSIWATERRRSRVGTHLDGIAPWSRNTYYHPHTGTNVMECVYQKMGLGPGNAGQIRVGLCLDQAGVAAPKTFNRPLPRSLFHFYSRVLWVSLPESIGSPQILEIKGFEHADLFTAMQKRVGTVESIWESDVKVLRRLGCGYCYCLQKVK